MTTTRNPLRLEPGWSPRRMPLPVLLGVVTLVVVGVLVGLTHRPTTGQRATDLRNFAGSVRSDIASCAGGVRESLHSLALVRAGDTADRLTALGVAHDAAGACAPDTNSQIYDLDTITVPESLAAFHLDRVVARLTRWAYPLADRVDADVTVLLRPASAAAAGQARSDLARTLRVLDAEGRAAQAGLDAAARGLHTTVRPLGLPVPVLPAG